MKIPASSITRISLYYRALLSLKDTPVISSQELAALTDSSAAQIRKDLAYFGQFGRPGSGYNKVPKDVELLNIDLSMGLERLTYFLQRNKK